tara:strand:- start:4945 stop:5472 length:528 start_codon:yes stop_codon:yes gene_type:complete
MFCPNLLLQTRLLCYLLFLALIAGCSTAVEDLPETVPVSGTVLFKGEPLKRASIIFTNPAEKPGSATANATTDDKGHFELKSYFGARTERAGVIPGTYTVTVLKMVPPGKMTEEEYHAKVKESDQIVSAGGVLTQEQTPPELKQMIPRQYSDASISKLEAKVVANQENQFQFDLK